MATRVRSARPSASASSSTKPVSRCLRWLYKHPGLPLRGAVRLAVTYARRTDLFRYWAEQIPSDFGTAFKLERIDPDGSTGEVYEVCADGEYGHCCCKGYERWGHCKHVDAARAIVAREASL